MGKKLDNFKMGAKKARMGLASRKIGLMKRSKLKFGVPKNIPDFRDEMIRIFDGKKKEKK